MCLLVALIDCVPGSPLILGANREEFYDRPSDPPSLIRVEPRTWGGRDRRAGGTWLAVNEYGVLAAVTNRRAPYQANARSRGLLCLDVLESSSAREGMEILQAQLDAAAYNAFNLFVSDGRESYAVHYEDWARILRLPEGLHLISDRDLNDLKSSRIRRAEALLADRPLQGTDETIAALRELLGDHESGVSFREMICIHGVESGTVSSSILALQPESMDQSLYFHLEGNPCEGTYRDYSFLFRGEERVNG